MSLNKKELKLAYGKKYRKEHRDEIKEKRKSYWKKVQVETTKRTRKNRKKRANWLWDLKCGLRCKDCGESHPACLDFHHRNPKEKEDLVCKMVTTGCSEQKILEEMDKCDVVCANCHRKLHCNHKWPT
jgi:hypothetical protein